MGLTSLIVLVAMFGQVPDNATPAYAAQLNRLEGLDKIALEEKGKAVAHYRDGVRSTVVLDLMDFAENELGLSPPYKPAEVTTFTEIADDICKPLDQIKSRVTYTPSTVRYYKSVIEPPAPSRPKVVVYRAGFRTVDINGTSSTVWCKPNPDDPTRGIYAIEDQPLEIRMRMRGEAPLPVTYRAVAQPVMYDLPPISFGCADGSCGVPTMSSPQSVSINVNRSFFGGIGRRSVGSGSSCQGGNCDR